MAENRGNPSGSKSNLPNPNGVTRTNQDNVFSKRDLQTYKDMSIANLKIVEMIQDITKSKNLKGFGETIDKLSESLVKAKQTVDREKKEIDETLVNYKKQLAKEIQLEEKKKGNQITIAQAYKMLMQTKEAQEFQKTHDRQIDELKKNTEKEYLKTRFKIEAKSKEINYLNSKFSKGNNLASTSNEYYSQLEKLKSDALDTFEDGLNNKEYKKALMNLNDKYAQDMKEAWKEDFKENHKVLGGIASGIKDTFDRNKETLQGLLGPLNLFIAPLKDFFGGFGAVFKFIGGGVKTIFRKFTKKNPTASDVLKTGAFGVGSLFIGHKLDELLGKGKNGKEDKLKGLKGLFNQNVAGSMGTMTKSMSGAIGAIGIGLVWMAVDAIRGIFKAKEWGTSKVSAGLGGALGGMDSGIKGAFKNMGKWALLGAGIGSFVPIIGTLAGGLIGGAIGGILGFIGGKNLAKGFDKLKEVLKNIITNMWEALKDLFNVNKFIAIFKSDESLGKKIGKAIGLWVVTMVEMIPRLMKKLFSGASNLVSSVIERSGKIKDAIGNLGISLVNGISNGFNKAKDFAKNTWEGLKGFGGDIWEGLKESELADFVKNIFTSLNEGIGKFFNENPVGKWMDSYIIAPIKNAFGQMGAWFSYIGNAFEKDGISGALSAMTVGMLKKDKSTGLTEFETYKQNLLNPTTVDDAIIRTDGSIIKTNPKDTLVALKDVPLSMEQVRNNTSKNLNSSLSGLSTNKDLENKLTTIIDVLSKILAKDVQVNLPPQTRSDLDILMSGGMI